MLSIMKKLKQVWLGEESEPANYESRLLWAIACTAFFGFLRLGEVFPPAGNCTPPLLLSDLGTDSHLDPTFFRILIRRAKNDPFGKGCSIFLGRTDKNICPTQALKRYLLNRPPGQGGLVPESRRLSMLEGSFCPRSLPRPVKGRSQSLALRFRIGAATTAATAGIPAHTIKRLGRWSSDAYTLYSINLIALYYIILLSSPLHQAANMQAFSPFPGGRHNLYFHFHTFYTIFITFPTTSMGSYHPSPLHSSNSTLITVTSIIHSKIHSIFASSNILFPWVFFGECHLPVGSWLK